MNEHLDDRTLQSHLDGDLPTEESWTAEAHLGGCPVCSARFRSLGALVEQVGVLEASLEPPADLWPDIAKRIGSRRLPLGGAGVRSRQPARGRRVIRWMFAAAAVLAVGIALGRIIPRPPQSLATDPPPSAALPAGLAAYDPSSAVYDQAIDDLLLVLAERRDELRPETVATIEENLRIIDAAIAESRAALEADPANESLHRHLSSYMQTKLAVLRMVTNVVAADI